MKKFFNLISLLIILSINFIEGRKIRVPDSARSKSVSPAIQPRPIFQEPPTINIDHLKKLQQEISIKNNEIDQKNKTIEDLKEALKVMEENLSNQKNSFSRSDNNDYIVKQFEEINKIISNATTDIRETNRFNAQKLNEIHRKLSPQENNTKNFDIQNSKINEFKDNKNSENNYNYPEAPQKMDFFDGNPLVYFNEYDKEKFLENSPGKVLREGKIVEKKKEIFKNFFEKKKKDYLKFLMPIAALKLITEWANENDVDFIPNASKYISSGGEGSSNLNKKENTEILNNEIIISLAENSKSFYGSVENSNNFHMFINTTEEFLEFIKSKEGETEIKNYCKKHSHSLKEFVVVEKDLQKELEEKLTTIIINFLSYFKFASSIKLSALNSTLISPLSLAIIPVFHDFLTFTPININKKSDQKAKDSFKFSDEAKNEINKFFNIKVKYTKVQEKLSVKISKHFRENKKKYIALGVAVGLIALGEISKKIIQGGYTGFGSKFLDSYSKNYIIAKDFALTGAKKLGEKAKSAGLKTKTFLEEKTKDFPGKVTKMTKNFSQKAKDVGEKFSEKTKGAFSKIFKKNENINSINQNPYQSDMKIEPNPKLTSNENKNFEPFKPYLDKSPLEKDLINYAKDYQPTGLL